jgi:hypothetical protein
MAALNRQRKLPETYASWSTSYVNNSSIKSSDISCKNTSLQEYEIQYNI